MLCGVVSQRLRSGGRRLDQRRSRARHAQPETTPDKKNDRGSSNKKHTMVIPPGESIVKRAVNIQHYSYSGKHVPGTRYQGAITDLCSIIILAANLRS